MTNYERELNEQPGALEDLLRIYTSGKSPLNGLEARVDRRSFDRVVFLGMGSSLFAAHPAVCRLARLGMPVQALDASEYIYYLSGGESAKKALHVLVSQSGESPEVKIIADRLAGSPFVALTNNPESHMAGKASAVLPIAAGEEKSTTGKTFTNTMAAGLLLAEWIAGGNAAAAAESMRQVPGMMGSFFKDWRKTMVPASDFLGDSLPHLDMLGRGPVMADVWQGGLIMRELAWVKCSAMNSGLFRHGLVPSMKDGGGVILFAPESPTKKITLRLAGDIGERGGRCLVIADKGTPLPGTNSTLIGMPSLAEELAPLLHILPIETLGILRAEKRGMEPGEGILKITPVE